jgi:quercetin dioxygenase-like cupin family protein
MEINNEEATLQKPSGDRIIDAPMVTIDLRVHMAQVKNEQAWKDNDRNVITVFKTDGLSMVLVALHKGTEMLRHSAPGAIQVQVLEGRMRFDTDTQSTELSDGQLMLLHERIPHSVFATEETIFLLTLTKQSTGVK